jgi:hypothetical protein
MERSRLGNCFEDPLFVVVKSFLGFGLVLAAYLFGPLRAEADDTLVIFPNSFHLAGPAARQQLLLERVQSQHALGQVAAASFTSSDPAVVKIEDGIAIPLNNGTATITAAVGAEVARAEVMVEKMDKPFRRSFRSDVQPVLAKASCSSGACHGAAAGQNGFKLSLRGYDDDADFRAITRHALGRRIVPEDPGRSLLLLKPTGAVPHKGGQRFDTNSTEYRILAEWIAAGTPPPLNDDARVLRVEILPGNVVLQPGSEQQLIVRAHFSDGYVRDVTRWVKYTDANSAVTQVDETGNVRVIGFGEGAITAWYLSRIAIATVTVPYTNKVAPEVFAQAKRRNFIDDLVLEKLQALNLPPSPGCSDAEFIRRAFIDTIGVLPAVPETRAFLASAASDKREQLIESLLQRPEFVDYWTYKWSDLLLVSSEKLRATALSSYYNWIRNNVAANTPWDQFVRQLVTAKGSNLENGAANFFGMHEDPTEMAETTSQAFLGMSINCAKCHNHPMEKWTNDEYFGFANLFARVRAKSGGGDGEKVIFAATSGEVVQPRTGRPQKPRPLDGRPLPFDDANDRREALADWLTAPDNPYFTRAIVNRVWANFLGVGLVERVDDLRLTNPASNDKLLAAAAHFLAEHKFDMKALMRVILESETYQRRSAPLPENIADERFYSRYYPKRLMAEVMLDAISQVTDVATEFKGAGSAAAPYPVGWRALQLPDSKVTSYFLDAFGRPDRLKTCECERTAQPSMTQVLHIANGDTVNKKLQSPKGRVAKLLADKVPNDQLIEEAYLSALCRYPTTMEKERIAKVLSEAQEKDMRPAIEDIYWAILSSREFLFNH